MEYNDKNGMPNMSGPLEDVIDSAARIAVKYKTGEIGTEQILYGLTHIDSDAKQLLNRFGADDVELEEFLSENRGSSEDGQPDFTTRVKNVLINAHNVAIALHAPQIDCKHVLYALIQESSSVAVAYLVKALNVNLRELSAEIQRIMRQNDNVQDSRGFMPQQNIKPNTPPQKNAGRLPAQLASMGVDITEKARLGKMDPIIGRSNEIERIIQILCRKTKNNPVLIGEPGVGKSAVIEGLSQKIVKGEVPDLLKDKIIFSLDIGSLVAGTKYRGTLEEKLKEAIDAVTKSGNIIMFIDELHTLATVGGDKGEVNPADMLKPYLARGELQTIGATTTDEYRKFIEADKALERRFQPIMVEPPTIAQTIEILKGLRPNYEKFHGVKISDEAIDAAANLSDRYIMDRFLPDKAIDLIDEASSKAKVNNFMLPPDFKDKEDIIKKLETDKSAALLKEDYARAARIRDEIKQMRESMDSEKMQWTQKRVKNEMTITAEDIAAIISSWTSIPVTKLNETEKERLMKLEEILHKRVIGQEEAIVSVSRAIRRARAGLKDPNRPIGSFIFLGPTGVGKTELTKAIAEAMFDDENLIIRLDMSEYMESHSVSKLIGSPPGYVGYDEGGQLTEAVRRKPYSVVLFDEIEKAHPDVFNALLQILDEGRLTDSQGRVVSFKNTIIVLTSNVGVSELKKNKSLGFVENSTANEKNKDILMNALKMKFKPEFLNRIDVISVFSALDKSEIEKITNIMLDNVKKKLSEKSINIKFSPECVDWIAEKGYDAEYGARPLRRVIEQNIEDNLAEQILTGAVNESDNITVGIRNGEIVFDINKK